MKEYNCTLCGRRFSSRSEASSHVRKKHERDARGANPNLLIKEADDVDYTYNYYNPKRQRVYYDDGVTVFEALLQLISRFRKRKKQ
jgi:hypothetical protein